MCPKSYRRIFASHSSTTSPSGFKEGDLGLYDGKFVGDINQSFTINTPAVAIAQWEKSWTTDLRVAGLKTIGR